MSQQIFSLSSWPRAILHLDGDAFFTSCEEAIHPELRGNPTVREQTQLKGETRRRHPGLPLLHVKT